MSKFPNVAQHLPCRDVDPELFFPVGKPGTKVYDATVAQARAVCAPCPLRSTCLDQMGPQMEHGVVGGFDAPERQWRAWTARKLARRNDALQAAADAHAEATEAEFDDSPESLAELDALRADVLATA